MRISDWSSDVCSSELVIAEICNAPRGSAVIIGTANLFRSPDVPPRPEPARMPEDRWVPPLVTLMREAEVAAREIDGMVFLEIGVHLRTDIELKIGRASCSERVGQYV